MPVVSPVATGLLWVYLPSKDQPLKTEIWNTANQWGFDQILSINPTTENFLATVLPVVEASLTLSFL